MNELGQVVGETEIHFWAGTFDTIDIQADADYSKSLLYSVC